MLVAKGETEKAIPYLNELLAFPEDDFTKLAPDHAEKKKTASAFVEKYQRSRIFIDNPVPFEPVLIEQVSSELDEYFPMISPDNDLMFFTRKINRKNLGDISDNIVEEFTVSERLTPTENVFNYGSPVPAPFNDGSFFNYGTASLSADNKEMVICACKKELVYNQTYLNCDLFTTTYKRTGKGGNDFQWTPLVNMGAGINTKDGWEAQPSLSPDGKTLFYATLRKGSRNNDIYIAIKQDDGTWSEGKPFNEINTAGKDKSPFFHQDGETLYFVSESSEERPGVGGLDIFYIRKTDQGWSKPENIGYPINTSGEELGIFVSAKGDVAYYSSYQNGNWNIYGFDLYLKAQPKSVVILKGQLTDDKNQPVVDGKIEIAYGSSGEKMVLDVNQEDGKYAAVVKVNANEPITVTLKKEGTAFNSSVITKEQLTTNSLTVNMTSEALKAGKTYNIKDILYGTDSYELTNTTKLILKRFAEYLTENASLKIAIQGHTDDLGDDNKNLALSESRAKAVMEYLIEEGVEKERLSSKGFGEKQPKFPNNSDANRAKNRRTEFLLLSE
jgi:outer membrane protein OmpA-like peptidoglycan-associated protein